MTARDKALVRMLADWEAGRMTDVRADQQRVSPDSRLFMLRNGLLAVGLPGRFTLTPAGLAAARAIATEDK